MKSGFIRFAMRGVRHTFCAIEAAPGEKNSLPICEEPACMLGGNEEKLSRLPEVASCFEQQRKLQGDRCDVAGGKPP